MARLIKKIEIEGKEVEALFDTGAWNTYVEKDILEDVPIRKIPKPYKVGLGGKELEVTEICTILGKIEGLGFHTEAIPIEKIGIVDGKEVKAIIGVLTMERWEIIINLKQGTLNLDGLRRGIFIEY
jgi:hypothetical protein